MQAGRATTPYLVRIREHNIARTMTVVSNDKSFVAISSDKSGITWGDTAAGGRPHPFVPNNPGTLSPVENILFSSISDWTQVDKTKFISAGYNGALNEVLQGDAYVSAEGTLSGTKVGLLVDFTCQRYVTGVLTACTGISDYNKLIVKFGTVTNVNLLSDATDNVIEYWVEYIKLPDKKLDGSALDLGGFEFGDILTVSSTSLTTAYTAGTGTIETGYEITGNLVLKIGHRLANMETIQSTSEAYAAIQSDGTVISWEIQIMEVLFTTVLTGKHSLEVKYV